MKSMKRVNFENGKITQNILGVAMPMLVAQLISLLYNVIDRIYIARIPDVGTAALGGVGLCFPIIIIGTAGFVMQLTNSLVSICCNSVLSRTGGDVYVSVMTIVSSVRQIVETPIWSIAEGASPVISYNYGARKPNHVKKSIAIMSLLAVIYMVIAWSIILIAPGALISVFSSDSSLISDSIPALKIYFAAFAFMLLQYIGQTTFKSLNKKKQAIFFSLLRKAIIVVPLTYLLPYAFHLGTNGVFMAEPVSNILGGSACFITMLLTVIPELNRMKK